MIETRGLIALVEATDAMLKSANVELIGPMTQVGNAMVTACVSGDVAAVKAATEAGRTALLAGRLPQRAEARASSPLEGRVTNH